MNRLSLYTLGVASTVAYASVAVAQGTGDTTAAAPAAAPAAMSADAPATSSRPFGVGVLAGATIPTGDLSKGAGTGWHAGAFVTATPEWPVSFRLEGVYDDFGTKDINTGVSAQTASSHPSIVSGRINGVWHFPMTGDIKPYVIAGVGYYHIMIDGKCSSTDTQNPCGDVSTSENKFGVNAGAGIDMHLSGFSAFVEARWHDIFTSGSSSQLVPISVGLRF